MVQEGITDEKLGVAVRLGNDALRRAIDDAQARLRETRCSGQTHKEMVTGMIRCIHLFTGADGQSHVEDTTIPLGLVQAATAVHFEETAAGSALDWHTAPHVQYVITLSGTLEFTTRDGETFVLHPGDVLLAADTTGSGHRWRLIDDQPWRRLYVELSQPA